MELDPTRMCELLVGLPDVDVLGVDQPEPGALVVLIEPRQRRPSCGRCSTPAWVKDRREVDLVDLPAFDHAKEALRFFYDIPNPAHAETYLRELAADLQDETFPAEVNKLGRTLTRWFTPIINWHRSRASNGPIEAINNLIKRVKRVAFGFARFDHYRIRSLLYAGRPDWSLLETITPR